MPCFASVLQYISTKHTKHPKNIENKHWKTQKTHNTLVHCGCFPRAKNFDCIAQNTFHKTSAKHRKTSQNTAKQSQNAFCEITSRNTTKQTQNAQDCHKTVAITRIARIRCILQKYVGSVAKAHNTQYAIYAKITGGGSHTRRGSRSSRIVDVSCLKKTVFCGVLRCVCGVLRCFVCVFLAFFTKQHKTDQTVCKTNQGAEQRPWRRALSRWS